MWFVMHVYNIKILFDKGRFRFLLELDASERKVSAFIWCVVAFELCQATLLFTRVSVVATCVSSVFKRWMWLVGVLYMGVRQNIGTFTLLTRVWNEIAHIYAYFEMTVRRDIFDVYIQNKLNLETPVFFKPSIGSSLCLGRLLCNPETQTLYHVKSKDT